MELKLKKIITVWHTFQEGGNSFGFHCSSVQYSFKEEGKILRVTEKIVAMLVSGGALVVHVSLCNVYSKSSFENNWSAKLYTSAIFIMCVCYS